MSRSRPARLAPLALALALGCRDGTAPPVTGDMTGMVQLYSKWATPLRSNEGATVELVGTPHAVTTDASGAWTLSGVPAGTYDIVIRKPGFGTWKVFGYAFPGRGTDWVRPSEQGPDFRLAELPTHSAAVDSTWMTLPTPFSPDTLLWFRTRPTESLPADSLCAGSLSISKSSDMADEFPVWIAVGPTCGLTGGRIEYYVPMPLARQTAAGGGTLYVATYAYVGIEPRNYVEPATGRGVSPWNGPRSVIAVTLP